ncbi:unnamed protein product [Rhizopus stolonifer]
MIFWSHHRLLLKFDNCRIIIKRDKGVWLNQRGLTDIHWHLCKRTIEMAHISFFLNAWNMLWCIALLIQNIPIDTSEISMRLDFLYTICPQPSLCSASFSKSLQLRMR